MATFSTLPATPLQFLWHPWLPLGKITLLIGDPGANKSLLALHLAAQLSRGLPLGPSIGNPSSPSQSSALSPQSSLLLTSSDDPADTILPRLLALNANPDLIHRLPDLHSLIPEPRTEGAAHSAPSPLEILDDYLDENPAIRFLLLDPLVDFLGPTDKRLATPDSPAAFHRARTIFAALTQIAAHRRIAILAIARLTKNLTTHNLYRAAGSHAFASTARAVHLLTVDPDSPHRRLLIPLKTNLTLPPAPLAFTVTSAPSQSSVLSTQASHSSIPTLTWESTPPIDLPSIPSPSTLKPRSKDLATACDFLTTALADGPLECNALVHSAAQNLIAKRTLERAKIQLNITSYRPTHREGWFWRQPNDTREPPTLWEYLEQKRAAAEAHLQSLAG